MKAEVKLRVLAFSFIAFLVLAGFEKGFWGSIAQVISDSSTKVYFAEWTGFGETGNKGDYYRPAKTLWDWMELLIIPIFLTIGVILINRTEQKTERVIATDRQQEAALQSYLDRMGELLLKEKLLTTENDEVRNVARMRTLTVLRGLDPIRKGFVLQFLYEAGLINKGKAVVSLSSADFQYAYLENVKLQEADLQGAYLFSADVQNAFLERADLRGADLSSAKMQNAILQGANLQGASLWSTKMQNTDLRGAYLRDALLADANFVRANLRGANLQDANLDETNFTKANLQEANLENVFLLHTNFRFADLRNAKLPNDGLRDSKLWKAQM